MGASSSPSSTGSAGQTSSGELADLHVLVARRLEHHEHRYTRGRRRLIEALARAGGPVTLPQIAADNADVPQSSAYRNLEVLERCGVISRIAGTADHAHFELAEPLVDHHHHLVCLACGTLTDVHLGERLEQLIDAELAQAAAAAGFTPTHHSLDLHGYCRGCDPES